MWKIAAGSPPDPGGVNGAMLRFLGTASFDGGGIGQLNRKWGPNANVLFSFPPSFLNFS